MKKECKIRAEEEDIIELARQEKNQKTKEGSQGSVCIFGSVCTFDNHVQTHFKVKISTTNSPTITKLK